MNDWLIDYLIVWFFDWLNHYRIGAEVDQEAEEHDPEEPGSPGNVYSSGIQHKIRFALFIYGTMVVFKWRSVYRMECQTYSGYYGFPQTFVWSKMQDHHCFSSSEFIISNWFFFLKIVINLHVVIKVSLN